MTETDAPPPPAPAAPHHHPRDAKKGEDEPLLLSFFLPPREGVGAVVGDPGSTNPNTVSQPRQDKDPTAASWLLDFRSSAADSRQQQESRVTPASPNSYNFVGSSCEDHSTTSRPTTTTATTGRTNNTNTTTNHAAILLIAAPAAPAAAAATQNSSVNQHSSSPAPDETIVSSTMLESSMPPPPPPVIAEAPPTPSSAGTTRTGGRRSRLRHEILSSRTHPTSCSSSGSTSTTSTTTTKSRRSSSGGTAEACLVHCPTLEELQKTTFSNYVRHTVLAAATIATTTTTAVVAGSSSTQAVSSSRRHSTKDDDPDCRFIRDDHAAPLYLNQGMARIRLPLEGLWTKSPPYGNDRTGRGPLWQSGTVLGDWILTSPMQQNIRGMAGVYEYTPTDLPSCTLSEFRIRADRYQQQQMGRVRWNGNKNDKDEDAKDDNNEDAKDDNEKEEEVDDSNKRIGQTNITRPKATDRKVKAKTGTTKSESASTLDNTDPDPATTPSNNNNDPDDDDLDPHHRPGDWTRAQVAELERQFWKRLSPTMPPAVYGADEAGTLFGDDPASGWSLAQLDSCLHVLSSDIPGVTSPYLYAGMWASVFCAHAEDMNLLSINYLHAGQPKVWYAIAQPDAARFVSLAEHHYSHQLKQCKEFLRHKRCLLSPAILKKAGIRYQTTVQYPGDAVITFPGGFHFGFNAGFNLAEATNFGVPEWIPFGRMARVCLCRPDSVRIDMNRFVTLLRRYQRDRQRNKRLTWKSWRQREERKNYAKHIVTGIVEETDDTIVEVISCARKKRKTSVKKQSEQQRKNEFWIEVASPASTSLAGSPSKKTSRSGSKNAALAANTSAVVNRWHLAKPIGRSRKRLEVNTAVLCLVSTVPSVRRRRQEQQRRRACKNGTNQKPDDDGTSSSDSLNEFLSSEDEPDHDDDEHEECLAGTIVEVADGYVRIHLEGLPKSQDLWILQDSPKLFLDGGVWEETDAANHPPQHHYWKEMDSKKRLCD